MHRTEESWDHLEIGIYNIIKVTIIRVNFIDIYLLFIYIFIYFINYLNYSLVTRLFYPFALHTLSTGYWNNEIQRQVQELFSQVIIYPFIHWANSTTTTTTTLLGTQCNGSTPCNTSDPSSPPPLSAHLASKPLLHFGRHSYNKHTQSVAC